jgi:hypothetical protein
MFVSTFLTLLALSGAVSAWCGASDPSKEGLAIHRELREKEASGLHPRQADGNQIEVYIHVFAHEESDSTIARDVRQQVPTTQPQQSTPLPNIIITILIAIITHLTAHPVYQERN